MSLLAFEDGVGGCSGVVFPTKELGVLASIGPVRARSAIRATGW